MKLVFLALLLAIIPAHAEVAADGAPVPKAAAPFNDPQDGMIGTHIKSGVAKPGDAVQDPLGARILVPKAKFDKADRPLGMG